MEIYYNLSCDRYPDKSPLESLDLIEIIENSAHVSIRLLVGGTYFAGFDTEKQINVLVFKTDEPMQSIIYHENPYSESYITCIPEDPCPPIILAFTADLDWSILIL